ncbi:MAG: AsmA-like C-terminal region-containing protein [Candidatus Omnitrophota bacterium]
MKRKIIFIVLAALLLGLAGSLYYVNKVLLPTFVEKKIVSGLSNIPKGRVTLGKLRFNILRGLVANDLVLFDKDDPKKELCSVKEASASFLILPLLKERKIIVPSIKLDSLRLDLIRRKDSTLNISYLINKPKTQTENKAPDFLVKSLSIKNSAITFTDGSFQAPVFMTLKLNDLLCGLSWNKINAQADIELIKDTKKTNISVKASYFYANQNIAANLSAKNFDTKTYAPYLKVLTPWLDSGALTELKADYGRTNNDSKINAQFSVQGASVQNKGITLRDASGLVSVAVEINAKDNIAKISGNINLSGIKAEKDSLTLQNGALESDVRLTLPFQPQEEKVFSYEGTAKIKSAEISGIKTIGTVSDITSSLKFKDNDVIIEKSEFKALGSTITAEGKIKQNILDLDLSGILDLQKLPSLLPKDIKLPAFDISGTTDVKIHVKSDLAAETSPSISGEAKLENMDISLPDKDLKFETESGRLKFDLANQNIQWHIDAVKYLNETYSFDGQLKNFNTPVVNAMIVGKILKLQSEFIKDGSVLQITSLKGQFKNSGLNIKGQFDSSKENIDLRGSVLLDISDIAGSKYEGKCILDVEAFGPVKNYKSWNAKAVGRSKALKCLDYTIKNVALNYTQAQRQGFINGLYFDAYGGKGLIKGHINFLDNAITYSAKGILQDIDLSLLKLNLPMKEGNFYGTAALNISIQGKDSNLNNLKGNGAFVIKNGNVGEFNPLKGLGNFLFISKFSNIVFTRAQGDFSISDGYAATNNLELLGPEMGLIAEGKISFDGTLDFLVNTQVSIPGAETISKAAGLTAIRVTGTVKEPKYKLQPIAENIMKKLGEIFSNIVP